MIRRKKGYFSISAVAQMFSIHPQTIRLYEEEGLITPKRTPGNTRLFSEEDINKLEEIVYLTNRLGINMAGVQMVLKLKRQLKKMQKDMNALFESQEKELIQEEATIKASVKNDVTKLMTIKQDAAKNALPAPKKSEGKTKKAEVAPADVPQEINWEIDYES